MMILILALLTLLVVPLVLRLYLDKKTAYIAHSVPIWQTLYADANKLIEDDTVPDSVAEFIYGLVMTAGCGCYTTLMIKELFLGRMGLVRGRRQNPLERSIAQLTEEQRRLLSHVIGEAIYFDSYQVPLRGVILRRACWWLFRVTQKPSASLPQEQLQDVATTANDILHKKAEDARPPRILVHC